MRSFRHTEHPLRIFSGEDALGALEGDLARQGIARAVIFTGRTLAASPWVETVETAAGARCAGVYAGCRTHTPRDGAVEAAEALKRLAADAILVLGGGSAVITARAASIFQGEGYDLDRICTRRLPDGTMHSPRLMKPKVPLVILPTTPNTAYVKAGAGVFDPEAQERKAVFDPQTRARSIFLHPGLLMSAPPGLVISASLDTLLLAVEGLLARQGDAISDALLMQAIRLLSDALPRLGTKDGPDLRLDLTMAGILAGRGTDHAPAGAVTALGHAIGANHHVENGVAKAVILPHMLRWNGAEGARGLEKLAQALCLPPGDPLERVIAHYAGIFAALGLPDRLSTLGIPADALPVIAERAMKDWFILGNCRVVRTAGEMFGVLQDAC